MSVPVPVSFVVAPFESDADCVADDDDTGAADDGVAMDDRLRMPWWNALSLSLCLSHCCSLSLCLWV